MHSHTHRGGDLRQSNKKHKKEKKSLKGEEVPIRKNNKSTRMLNKKERRLQSKQIRDNKAKILKMVNQERGLQMPIYVVVIPLDKSVDPKLLITLLTKTDKNIQKETFNGNSPISHYYFQRYKSRVSFISADPTDLFSCIDLVNMADFVLFVTPNDVDLLQSKEIDRLFTVLYSQGLPSTLFAVMSNYLDLNDLKKVIEAKFPVQEEKVRCLNDIDDACVFMRHLTTSKTPLNFSRDKLAVHAGNSATCQTAGRLRSSILAECIECIPAQQSADEAFIRVKGLSKGAPFILSESLANDNIELEAIGPYVHLPGWGDFKVDSAAWQKAKPINQKTQDGQFFAWHRRKQFDLDEEQNQRIHEQEMIEADDQCLPSDDESGNDDDEEEEEEEEEERMEQDEDPDENDSDGISVSSLPSNVSEEERANELRRRRLKGKNGRDTQELMDDGGSSCSSWATRSARTMASTVNTAFSEAQLAKFREARTEQSFPDEVETPRHISAKIRFCKYRGLERFRGSQWPLDQDPSLPLEYTRTFRFTNYQRNRRTLTKFFLRRFRHILQSSASNSLNVLDQAYIGAGSMVELCIGPMPKELAQSLVRKHADGPLVVWSLLVHERKMSIVHLNMRRVNRAVQWTAQMQEIARKANTLLQRYDNPANLDIEFGEEAATPVHKSMQLMEEEFADRAEVVLEAEPIKSKEPMLFQVGIRRFVACPIYSEVLLTKPDKEKAKYERFFPASGCNTMASMYAPMMYAPQHVLQFRIRSPEDQDGHIGAPYIGELVATGALSSVDPHRLIIKRIVLSGHPYKINKRSSVVRFMFFSPEDIEYFKPVKLYTKHGAVGHIKQSVGTHGYMKCFFNRQLNSCDVALMPLYKRQLPKWSYTPRIADQLSTEEPPADQTESLLKGMQLSQGVSFKPQRQDDLSMFDAM